MLDVIVGILKLYVMVDIEVVLCVRHKISYKINLLYIKLFKNILYFISPKFKHICNI